MVGLDAYLGLAAAALFGVIGGSMSIYLRRRFPIGARPREYEIVLDGHRTSFEVGPDDDTKTVQQKVTDAITRVRAPAEHA